MEKTVRRRIIAFVLFIVALCVSLIEIYVVSLTNGGYGVLDMTKYNADVFVKVMDDSIDMGIYWKYYIFDYLFTVAFLNWMIQMARGFKGSVISRIKIVSYIIAAIRGILDMVENSIMLNQIYSFPDVNRDLINMCNTITRIKFHFMRGWFVCFLLMVVLTLQKRKTVLQ